MSTPNLSIDEMVQRLRTAGVPEKVLKDLPAVAKQFNINTPARMAHFMSQVAHESGNFRSTTENLNYSASGLRETFSKYFPNDAIAKQYERQPEKIANRVYANRIGNGSEASGDGWKYRGRGYIQLTGRANYAAFDSVVPENIIANPDLVAQKYPLLASAYFWEKIGTNKNLIADTGSVEDVTRRVNGGLNGLQDRIKKYNTYAALFGLPPDKSTPTTGRPPLAPGPEGQTPPPDIRDFDPFTYNRKKPPQEELNKEYTKKFIEDFKVAMKAFREGTYTSLWTNLKVAGETAFKSTLDAYNTSKGVPPTGALAVNLSMTIDGISGIFNRQHFSIQEGILPKKYDNYAFIITNVEDKVQNNRWTTSIQTTLYDVKKRSQKEIDEAKKKIEDGYYVEPPKTSESTPKDVYPKLDNLN
jgi:putative chitinase